VAIVVEDGTVVAGANSYLSLAAVRAFALARGVTLSATDATVEVQLIKAKDYIEARDAYFVGRRVSEDQVLCWPRYAPSVRSDQVPAKIKDAQGFLVMADFAGVVVLPTGASLEPFPVTKKKVGPLEKSYAVPDGAQVQTWPVVPAAEACLAYYYKSSGAVLSVY
jgi:hypothetical protein